MWKCGILCRVEKIEEVGRCPLGKKLSQELFGNLGPLAAILLQTRLERRFLETVLHFDCTSQPISRAGRTGQQTYSICCAFDKFLCFWLLGILFGLIFCYP